MINWDEVVGHQTVAARLKSMLSAGKIPHALLFAGPAGIGKSLAARVVSAGILCSSDQDKPCGQCHSCRLFSRNAHPDFSLLVPEGATIKIDQIRLLKSFAALTPAVSSGRVCLIDNAELMTVQAANSLLKLLEEPPPGFVFILVAGTGKPLLPTILSRCWKVQFHLLPAQVLEDALIQKGYAPEAAAVAARLSGGRMGKALNLLAPDGLALRNMAAQMLTVLQKDDMTAIWAETTRLAGLEAKDIIIVLEFFLYLLRDLLLIAGRYSEQLIYNIDLTRQLAGLVPFWPEKRSMAAMAAVKNTIRALEANANARLALEELLILLKDCPEEGE
ncbi:DNA polymerase III subunit delta' [Sporomusa acidovorans]|uniref:DNA-directed DNA polymerase n=1 Tax=Sporomusa acidovorans (strain ATCC 49682 / DSM 3132 / Mol) TaxID=1123286 RepID=A0ABZ3IWU2_SPOA4|nr:DNA polymerase III subunit delta' [Sporomusa acidovorans]OZC13999.1 DNA polymerase III subunit tau [Sporomusa acidovorans DSM 3132]SDF22084.1 DNA polymerase-3 subunit delta' [Sporomusa acidovorans]